MKILVITPFFYPHTGGSQQYMEEIYAALLKKYKKVQVDVLCYKTDKSKEKEIYRGMKVYRIGCWTMLPSQFALPNPVDLWKFLYSHGNEYDVVHTSTRFFDSSWWAVLFAKWKGLPIFMTDHCATFPVHTNVWVNRIAKVIDLSIDPFFMKMYTKVFATNKATQKFLKNELGVNADVMYGGINNKIFKPGKPFHNKRLKILFIGRMIDSKGARYLFDLAQEFRKCDFLFVGPGPLVEEFQRKIEEQKITHIQIVGRKTPEEVGKLMQRCDLLVHPSYHHEGFPNVLTEAGGCAMPVIATDVGGSREIIINNKTGLLIKPKNIAQLKKALNKMIQSKPLRNRLAKNLYQHCQKNFRWDNVREQLYQELGVVLKSTRVG